jgi:hypothetical protein
MKIKSCKEEYLAKAKLLSKTQAERLLSRMSEKLYRRFKKGDLPSEEILGIQLEIEEDQLQEWRERMSKIREKEEAKLKEKEKQKG